MLISSHEKPQDMGDHCNGNQEENFPITIADIQKIFIDCEDLQAKQIYAGGGEHALWVCWLDGLTDSAQVSEEVLRPLTDTARFPPTDSHPLQRAARGLVYAGGMNLRTKIDDIADDLTAGCCAVIDDGMALCFQLKSNNRRSVETPQAEKTVKGGKDAFVETLRVNTALVRNRLRTPKLKLRQINIGKECAAAVAVLWLEGRADRSTVDSVMQRLSSADIDLLLQADTLQATLSDHPFSPFPQVMHTERSDAFAVSLTEGRVGLLVDGLPLGFLVPGTLPAIMRPTEDRTQHFIPASCLRLLRWAALLLAMFLPAFYVATAMYHQEMIPLRLLLSVIESKQNVPFPTPAEVLGMLIAFDLLQEAGLQLPDSIGQTVSIVGALIVGQSAVEAKVISPIAVIVVALAGIAGYTVPNQDLAAAVRLVRLCAVVAATVGGMFGLAVAAAALLWHLCSLQSFRTDYLFPMTSGRAGSGLRTLIRRPSERREK